MDAQILKQKLLATNYFINNEYLDKYVNLCCIDNTAEYLEKHHIIPFAYYAYIYGAKTKSAKNKLRHLCCKYGTEEYRTITTDNIVNLSYFQHCLAHYYLFNCTIGFLQTDTEFAFNKMTNRQLCLRSCTEQEIYEIIKLIKTLEQNPNSSLYKSNLINTVVKNNYGTGGYKLCLQILNRQYNLQTTELVIKARANALGITSNYFTKAWDDTELTLLKQLYPIGGWRAVKEKLPNRTKNAIQARAKYLGLQAPGPSKLNAAWSAEEDNIIKQYYSIGGVALCSKYLPNRSQKSIKHRANTKLKIYTDQDATMCAGMPYRGKSKVIYLLDAAGNILAEYQSIKEASIATKISTASIAAVCSGKIHSVKNKIFCFKAMYTKDVVNER